MRTSPNPELLRAVLADIEPSWRDVRVERVEEGVSTYVYRLHCGNRRYYLRMPPELGVSLAPEAHVLEHLHGLGISVPQVVYCSDHEATLNRSILVITEIPGRPVAEIGVGEHTQAVLFKAGRMLATINSLPVTGFGWIVGDSARPDRLQAARPNLRAFALEDLDEHLHTLEATLLARGEVARLRGIVRDYDAWLESSEAVLAHGDFDSTHIFQHGAHCSGIIDFGEIRGTDRWYDLGHFHYHDGEVFTVSLLPWLLDGYRSASTLPGDALHRISFAALLIGQRSLARLVRQRGVADPHVEVGVAALRRDMRILGG